MGNKKQTARLIAVTPESNMVLAATYSDGRVVRFNLSDLASRLQAFAALENPNEFATAKVADFGWTLEWDCGASLDSDRVIELALEQAGMAENVFMSNASVNIVSASQTGTYRLRILFDDKTVQEVDFGPFLAHSHHQAIRAFLEPERFSGFKVQYGELVWGDYELCFPVMDLYHNTIEHRELSEVG